MIPFTLGCVVLLLCLAVTGALVAHAPSGRGIVYGGSLGISLVSLLAALISLGGRHRRSSCRWACPGLARISGSIRWLRSS